MRSRPRTARTRRRSPPSRPSRSSRMRCNRERWTRISYRSSSTARSISVCIPRDAVGTRSWYVLDHLFREVGGKILQARLEEHVACRVRMLGLPDDAPQLWINQSKTEDRKSTRLNSSHLVISYAVF